MYESNDTLNKVIQEFFPTLEIKRWRTGRGVFEIYVQRKPLGQIQELREDDDVVMMVDERCFTAETLAIARSDRFGIARARRQEALKLEDERREMLDQQQQMELERVIEEEIG